MTKNKEERIAKQLIEKYLPDLCNKGIFIVVDDLKDQSNKSPDLQNDIDDIGIEVTIAEPQEEMEIKNVAFKKKTDKDFLNLKTKNTWSKPIIAEGGYRVLVGKMCTPTAYYKAQLAPLCDSLTKKLNKLNTTKNRKYFSSNGLFICNEMPLDEEKINEVYNLINKTQLDYLKSNPSNKIFDFIIISAQTIPDLICYFDMKNKSNNKIIEKE